MSAAEASRIQRKRLRRDRMASLWLTASGLGVMAIVVLMLGYLFSVSWPLIMPATSEPMTRQAIATADSNSEAQRLDTLLAHPSSQPEALSIASGVATSMSPVIARGTDTLTVAGLWQSDGNLQPVQVAASSAMPTLETLPVLKVPEGLSVDSAQMMVSDDQLWVSLMTATESADESAGRLWLARLTMDEPEAVWQQQWLDGAGPRSDMSDNLLITAGAQSLQQWELQKPSMPRSGSRDGGLARKVADITHDAASITAVSVLQGGESVIIGDVSGGLVHYLQPGHAKPLVMAGTFDSGLASPVESLVAAHHGRGFAALDASGKLGLYMATAERRRLVQSWLTREQVAQGVALTFSQDDHQLYGAYQQMDRHQALMAGLAINDPHQAVGLSPLLDKVWYEGRSSPEWIWQMGDADDSEPRLSLVPIMWGTLKAAVVGLLFAVPLGLGCAIHVACFMAPRQRAKVKPMLEMMEALPTVVIGFIAALVVAPFVERELMAVLLGLVFIPSGTIVAGFLWTLAPRNLRLWLPENMAAFGLLPLLAMLLWLDAAVAEHLEHWWFDGNLKQWLFSHYGIGYAQRNTLVTGMALGLAVMPTLFTLSEDALSSVPRQLAAGSAALGATPWQSLRRVILPAAAVGIFSALMIGMGRAVGETMIVLMVAGNTPLVDASLFEGLRSLAATLAIELPQADVGSSQYRLLFLAALALFVFTFIVNTLAELLRQRFTPSRQGGWG